MKYEAIFFDLDGTLLPMDNDAFMEKYFYLLHKVVEPYGYGMKEFVKAMWSGVEAMARNGSQRLNSECFWEVFASVLGKEVLDHVAEIDAFYLGEFEKVRDCTWSSHFAREAVMLAKEKAKRVVLATNPYFPDVAVRKRLEWAGLKWEDFDLVTFYDNSTRCKPNPEYYVEIAQKLGVDAEKCLMVGNNVKEDIVASQKVGMDTFLVTDCLIATVEIPKTKKGSLEALVDFLKND